MQNSPSRLSLPFPLGIVLGVLLLGAGLFGVYRQFQPKSDRATVAIATALLCKIYPPAPDPSMESSPTKAKHVEEVTSLTGATLKLSGAPKASLDETVVVSLCVESEAGLPELRRQALKNHLLVQLSAVGLRVEPRDKILTASSAGACLGTAEWTVRANAPRRYTAVLVPESTDDQPGRPAAGPAKPVWDFDLQTPARLDISISAGVDRLPAEILGRAFDPAGDGAGNNANLVEPAATEKGRSLLMRCNCAASPKSRLRRSPQRTEVMFTPHRTPILPGVELIRYSRDCLSGRSFC